MSHVCPRGHAVEGDNLYVHPKAGHRDCRACRIERSRRMNKEMVARGRRCWQSMIARCTNPRYIGYEKYGARGITVCDRWRNSFKDFIADIGARPSLKHQVDRIDNSKGYEPENCRWATLYEQQNNRTNNRHLRIRGQTRTVADWCRVSDVNSHTIRNRLFRGWAPERAVFERVSGK